jgi:subtilisin
MKQFTRGIRLCLMVILLVGLQGWSSATVPILISETVFPKPYRATWLETVQVSLSLNLVNMRFAKVNVTVAGRDAVTTVDPLGNTVSFVLPEHIWGGPQQFFVSGVQNQTRQILAQGTINVLGQSVFDDRDNTDTPTSIFFLSNSFSDLAAAQGKLMSKGIDIVTERSVGIRSNLGNTSDPKDKDPCGYKLYEARPSKPTGQNRRLSVGQVLEALENSTSPIIYDDIDGVLAVDPRPGDSLNPLSPGELVSSKNAYPIDAKVVIGGGITSSEDTTIAILDSGISETLVTDPRYHIRILEESTSFLTGVDSPRYIDGFTAKGVNIGHGTAVAALASSISPSSKILSIKVCNRNGKCPLFSVVQGICYAINYAKNHTDTQMILNLSFGSDTPSHIIYVILKYAMKKRRYFAEINSKRQEPLIRVVTSSGNDWKTRANNDGSLFHYPAALAGLKGLSTKKGLSVRIPQIQDLISVGAVGMDQRDGVFKVANFSNQGDYILIVAPGFNVISNDPNGEYQLYTGTSFAAPIAAGALALISPPPGSGYLASGEAIKEKLRSLVTPIYVASNINEIGSANAPEATGAGMLDLSSLPRR